MNVLRKGTWKQDWQETESDVKNLFHLDRSGDNSELIDREDDKVTDTRADMNRQIDWDYDDFDEKRSADEMNDW